MAALRRRTPAISPWEVAQRMVRARRPDGTPVDAGLIVAYLEHEAALAGVPVEELAPIGLGALIAVNLRAVGAAYETALRIFRDAFRPPPRQSDFTLAE